MRSLPSTADGLLVSSDLLRLGFGPKTLQRELVSGRLYRVRRGAYCLAEKWNALDERGRHLLRMRAVRAGMRLEPVFCDVSAAMALDLPWLGPTGDDVHICSAAASGGRSENGVRRHPHDLEGMEIVEADGLLVTGAAHTVAALAARLPFAQGVGMVDAALSRGDGHRATPDELSSAIRRLGPRSNARGATAAFEFGTHLSGSFGESYCRALMHELGYPTPELQVPFFDERGRIGIVDYWWPEARVIGEFDGAVKYHRADMRNGSSPSEIAWREKQREDRLRRQCDGFVRVVWAETMDASRLDAVLRASGLRPDARGKRPSRG
ncbi:type IV toxin-antitoxin system AbiEi family antitoxin domain-containing protein [Naasia lichenicola]|uniref:Type IV toxin-antitoxin system AbiEi family antitoxin domain-containing protein n=1 Tax=Naasia lichenicola TaxID=2565933 RepID=A0A4S4FNA7_9MICO|nr:type IV toxin-antitoxin system AbiEi family antitoxin domain-containing protein [Naasia lichenicola]THG30726.1 hypothetical protein E6C64_08795 [Naasia lichenicola]THG31963.1 hypothetical protein E6C64_07940 [Naasia lichenicola]